MEKLLIKGGNKLSGTITCSGAKNAALPMIASTILSDEKVTLKNLPYLQDITTMFELLGSMGADILLDEDMNFTIQSNNLKDIEARYELVKTMRASILVLGPLLAKYGKARIALPGGCAIGSRPVNYHLDSLEHMGAEIVLKNGYIEASAKRLKGANIRFDGVTVTGTENLMMAATLAEGTTTLSNVAREPEIIDLADILNSMGAKIEGINPNRLMNVIDKLIHTGAKVDYDENSISFSMTNDIPNPVDITTAPFPEFPTDMQAQFSVINAISSGTANIYETIFENRFMHILELNRMGCDISVNGNHAIIKGVNSLYGAEVMATDLRASASLILAGLCAKGETIVDRIYHIDRGYERIEEKLNYLGANIVRLPS